MDILAHTLWANAMARGANSLAKKSNEQKIASGKRAFRMHPGWTAFFGVAPDFFAFTIPFCIGLYNAIFFGKSFGRHHLEVAGFDLAAYLYQFSHSLVIFALVFVLVWVLSRRLRFELLGWALHILIDVPSHSISFYPTPFLFPISEYRFPYGVSWSNLWYMIINYSLLATIWSAIAIKKMRSKKESKVV
jgi:hypothetical protein